MLIFFTAHPARFSCRVDFSDKPYANLSFFAADGQSIPFHLSLRAPEGLAVCNRRGAGADAWGKEVRRQVALDRPVRLEIRFDAPRLRVLLDGREIFTFGAPLRRGRFRDLEGICYAEFTGAIPATSVDLEMAPPGPPDQTLFLDPRLELRGTLSGDRPALQLRIGAVGQDGGLLPLIQHTLADTNTTRLRALLPGRVWQQVPGDAPLRLRLCDGDRVTGELSLTREALLDRIAPMLEQLDLSRDPAMLAQVVEHMGFAGLISRLSAQNRARLFRLAANAGMDGFLGQADGKEHATPAAPASASAPESESDKGALRAALASVALHLRQPDPDPTALERLLVPPAGHAATFFISLAEPFCLQGDFDRLDRHARDHAIHQLEPGGDAWFNSGLLPYLLRAGRTDAVLQILSRLETETRHWIMTPPLAWTVSRALHQDDIVPGIREAIAQSFLRLVDKHARDYWLRSPCMALIDTAIDLVEARARFPAPQADRFEVQLLRAYGLSRDFWDRVGERGVDLPPRLAAAHSSFAVLSDPTAGPGADPAALTTALALFERAGCAEAPRVRRDLLGPAGLGGWDRLAAPTPQSLMQAGIAPGQAALRHMAFPGAAPAGAALTRAARTALPEACKANIPITHCPYAELQETATRSAADLLRAAQTGADPGPQMAPLLDRLRVLADARAGRIGLGLGLGLLRGLTHCAAPRGRRQLHEGLEDIARQLLTQTTAADLVRLPALALPLAAMNLAPDTPEAGALGTLARAAPALPGRPENRPESKSENVSAPRPANPLFDTLVTVFSCRANLDSRIPALRQAWLGRLAELGVPYVIVTGNGGAGGSGAGGGATLNGDILQLDAPDDYEGLPQKTLATIAWVHDHTHHAHMLKIDDDCFLNTRAFFHSLSYRKFDYYGRILALESGQMDRVWHCAKSTSPRGRLELDKSPEPSTYCDGGSGYTLSRRAMAAALGAAASPEGQALIRVSFMEDKLLGDLLSLHGVRPGNEDYHVTLRRRSTPAGIPVPRWHNGFDASLVAPVKLIHLDDEKAQKTAAHSLNQSHLTPKKIWPSYQGASLGEQSNALEMISPANRLDAARGAAVAVVACMRNEMFMLPHFLAHYRRLGVDSFLIADNGSDDGTLEYLAEQPDVALFAVDTDYNLSHYGVAWQQALMANLRPNRWSLVADADELLVWEKTPHTSLPELVAGPGFEGADAARVFMLDLYPEGPLAQADFTSGDPFAEAGFSDREPFLQTSFGRGPYSNSPTWTSAVRHRLIPGSRAELFVAQKLALLKYTPWLRLSAGLHYVAGARLARRELFFGHFKYNAQFPAKARAEVARRQHFNDAEEYRKYLGLLSEGRDLVHDPEISVPWQSSAFVRERLR